MGNTTNQSNLPHVVKNQPDSWKVIDTLGYCQIVKHLQTSQVAQSYTIHLPLPIDLIAQYSKYEYRRTNIHHLVRVYQVAKNKSQYLCSGIESLNVKTERVMWRLGEIRKIRKEEGVYLLWCCLEGYGEIRKRLGVMRVEGNMVGVTEKGEIRVWVNQNFGKNWVEGENQVEEDEGGEEEKEMVMLRKVFEIVFDQIENSKQVDEIKQLFNQKSINTFESALEVCKQIVSKIHIDINTMKIDVTDIDKYQRKQQPLKQHLSMRPMQISNIELNQISQIQVKEDSFKVQQPGSPKFTVNNYELLKTSEELTIQTKLEQLPNTKQVEISQNNKPQLFLTQSPPMPLVIPYDPIRQSIQSITVENRQSDLNTKFSFPIINQSRFKGKPPKPIPPPSNINTPSKNLLTPNTIPNSVIEAIDEIERSRSREGGSRSEERKKVEGILYESKHGMKPTGSPIGNRRSSKERSLEKKTVVINERMNQTYHQPSCHEKPFQESKPQNAKPFTSITYLEEPKFNSATTQSFQFKKKPFSFEKSFNLQKLPIKYDTKPQYQVEISTKKYSSVEKNYPSLYNTPTKNKFETNTSLDKSKSSYSFQTAPSFDINSVRSKFTEYKIKQPSFGMIPESNIPVYRQALHNPYKGIMDNKLDLSKYAYNY